VLIERTTTPMRAAARVLLDRGLAAPADVIEMVRRGCDQVDLRGTIGAAALPEGHSGRDEGDADDGGQSDAPELLEAARHALKRPLRPSESDSHEGIVAVLDGNRRVISDGVQWILQKRSGTGWKSRSYCRTKEALIRCCGGSTPELDALPDRIGDRVRGYLYKPEGAGPFPAVIGMHGCDGLVDQDGKVHPLYGTWGETLSKEGYLVLLPDGFGSRGHGNLCAVQPIAASPARAVAAPRGHGDRSTRSSTRPWKRRRGGDI
jgi:hypothetical protein